MTAAPTLDAPSKIIDPAAANAEAVRFRSEKDAAPAPWTGSFADLLGTVPISRS